jgi:hypothetical protein
MNESNGLTEIHFTVAFTESTLGRFLLAVEFYVLVVFVLLAAFYDYVPKSTDPNPNSTFEGVPQIKRVSTFRVKPPVIDNPAARDISYQNHPYGDGRPERPSRSSATSRLSSWIVSRRMSRRYSMSSGDRVQLWNQNEAERGESAVEKIVIDRVSAGNSPIGQLREVQNGKGPVVITTLNDIQHSAVGRSLSRWTPTASGRNSPSDNLYLKNTAKNDFTSAALSPPRLPGFESATYSIGSYYGGGSGKSAPNTPPPAVTGHRIDSPVYGLNGIVIGPNPGRETPGSTARSRSSTVSFTELLRQQTELDNSIAALRLLSPQQETRRDSKVHFDLPADPTSPNGAKDVNRSNSSVEMPSSMRSEFSLSNFPEPPLTFAATTNGQPSPTSTLTARFDKDEEQRSRSLSKSDGVAGLPIPRMPILSDFPSSPHSLPDSPGRDSGDTDNMSVNMSRMKVHSAGTQYDVTSFIGSTLNSVKVGFGILTICFRSHHSRVQERSSF